MVTGTTHVEDHTSTIEIQTYKYYSRMFKSSINQNQSTDFFMYCYISIKFVQLKKSINWWKQLRSKPKYIYFSSISLFKRCPSLKLSIASKPVLL